jgi:phosphoribosylformylglycinamidine synthase
MKAQVLVLRSAGSNCDEELVHAFGLAGADVDLIHINRIIESPSDLERYQILGIPGGFTYGDDVAAGLVLANELRHRLGDALRSFFSKDRLGIGVCNGFQVLVKTGLLPGNDGDERSATLTDNESGKFEGRWVWLQPASSVCPWTVGLKPPVYFPVAHAEGKFITRSAEDLAALNRADQVVFRYSLKGGGKPSYPADPNGSQDHIAGVCDPTGRILGMMPHPERHVDGTQHPNWTRDGIKPEGDGLQLFRNAVNSV